MAVNLMAGGVWATIGYVCIAILVLLIMITVHEFGHYIAGKIFKFKIEEFSIGFGPALFKRRSKKTGELFAVRLIPLGGYCAFAGEDGLEEESQAEQAAPAQEDAPAEEPVFAELTAENAEQAEAEDAAAPLAAEPAVEKQPEDKSRYFTNKPCWQRIIVLVSGALMNYILALVLIMTCFLAYGQSVIGVYRMEEGTGEYAAYSLQERDLFLEIDGHDIYLTTDVVRALNGKKQGDIVTMRLSRVISTEEGEDGTVRYVREEVEVPVMLRADVQAENSTDVDPVWAALGIAYEEEGEYPGYQLATARYRFGFFKTVGRSFVYSFQTAGSILSVLGELLTGQLSITSVGGPVTTITMTAQVASRGMRYLLEIAGFIGVNLAVFNLLPIPALDGCKVVFTVIEWIRGKPVSRKIEAIVNVIGFVFLLGFAILVDILQAVL